MKQTLSTSQLVSLLCQDEYAGWKLEEAIALADWYEELEESIGEELEFDAVEIRMDWSSWADLDEFRGQYEDCPEDEEGALDYISESGQYIKCANSILITNF